MWKAATATAMSSAILQAGVQREHGSPAEVVKCPATQLQRTTIRDYYANNPGQGYCKAVVGPKVAKFRKPFASKLNE
eukprot:Em0013g827a